MALADKLREFLMAQNPWVKMDDRTRFARLNDVIDRYGWQGYKTSPFAQEIRKLIQETGTEAGRNVIGKNVWIGALAEAMPPGDIVVSDVRFDNEAEMIRLYGNGHIFKVHRPGIEELVGHSSEDGIDERYITGTIINDGTLEDLVSEVIDNISALGI